MLAWIQLAGPNRALEVFGIRLVGINAENGKKLLFSLILIVGLMLLSKLLRTLARGFMHRSERVAFWVRQGIHVFTAAVLIIGLMSIWFDDPARMGTAFGLMSAGLAFALQRVITSIAGYFVILKGDTFNVGDRIVMGGVRGDVVALGFTQTTIMEMGQPPGEQGDKPSMWVKSRQYTGRMVTVPNAKIFDEPIYNYTREFPYLWEELSIPIAYRDDRRLAEKILLQAAEKHTTKIAEMSEEAIREMERRYVVKRSELKPQVFLRLTDNWVELTVRFVVEDHGIRGIKDAMSRDILDALDQAKIEIASATFEIVGVPPIQVRMSEPAGRGDSRL